MAFAQDERLDWNRKAKPPSGHPGGGFLFSGPAGEDRRARRLGRVARGSVFAIRQMESRKVERPALRRVHVHGRQQGGERSDEGDEGSKHEPQINDSSWSACEVRHRRGIWRCGAESALVSDEMVGSREAAKND
jgi:hypothetical protein